MSTEEVSLDSKYVLLHKLRKVLRHSGLDLKNLLHQALVFLHKEMDVDTVSVFLGGEDAHVLKEYLRLEQSGEILAGEHEQLIWKGSVLWELMTGVKNIYVAPYSEEDPFYTVFVRLSVGAGKKEEFLTRGFLRAVLSRESRLEVLVAWCEEVAEWLELNVLEEKLKEQSRTIESFSELSWLFVTSLRLEDRLRLILEGMQRLFHFDRMRLYLRDPENKFLRGTLEANLRGEVHSLRAECYSLDDGRSLNLVELLSQRLKLDPWSQILDHSLASHDKVLYITLKIQHKEIGVLAVDNLLSQEAISRDTRNLLQSFAGQIALAVDNARLFGEIERLSFYDSSSRLPNRRFFEMRFQDELYRSSRNNMPLALCLLDLDFFKEINDVYGHQIGDQAIIAVGEALQSSIRQIDFAARWGGDEMAVVLGSTSSDETKVVAERIIEAIRKIVLVYPANPPKEIKITASMGVAMHPQDGRTLEELVMSADRALYQVKFRGRNGFCLASQIQPENRS